MFRESLIWIWTNLGVLGRRWRRQAHWVDLGSHLELLTEHDDCDVVVQRQVVELRVDVDLLGAVELPLLGRLEGDVAQSDADVARLVGNIRILTLLQNISLSKMIKISGKGSLLTLSGNKQWAAVRTCQGEMATPPQNG